MTPIPDSGRVRITSRKRPRRESGYGGAAGLQVAQRIYRVPVDPDLEVQVGAEAVAGAAHVADHLSLGDLGAGRHRERGLVGVTGRETPAVVDARVVAVAARPPGQDDRSGRGGVDRRAVGNADVDTGVQP